MIDRSLPLVDLHRHLDGNVRTRTILELAQQHGVTLPASTEADLQPHVSIVGREAGLMAFIGKFRYLTAVLVDLDACRRIAVENVQDAAADGIDYVELRFSPWFMAEANGLDPAALVEAVADGVRAGCEETGVRAGLIGILSRTYGPEVCEKELDALMTHRDQLVALDLAGDEAGFPAELFKRHFDRARDSGLAITVHAGEADGPHSVWSAIRDLGARRIGHGLRAWEDPELVEYLVDQQIGLEVCLTSNLHISAIERLADHPLKKFLGAGVLASLNTDDPSISAINLSHEYRVAAPAAGLTADEIRQCQINGLAMAFLDKAEKKALRERCRQRA